MKKIINKVLEELKSENPKLDYIRGLLEAISEEETIVKYPIVIPPDYSLPNNTGLPLDEASVLEAQARDHIIKFGSPSLMEI